jgi:hypothetical protein
MTKYLVSTLSNAYLPSGDSTGAAVPTLTISSSTNSIGVENCILMLELFFCSASYILSLLDSQFPDVLAVAKLS